MTVSPLNVRAQWKVNTGSHQNQGLQWDTWNSTSDTTDDDDDADEETTLVRFTSTDAPPTLDVQTSSVPLQRSAREK